MIRLLPALALLSAFAAPGAALAQNGAYYVAVPEQASKERLITRSTPWALRGEAYVANRAPERDLVLCQLLARDVGRLKSFSAGGGALDDEALAKCNSRAKAAGGTAVAASAR